MKKIILMMMLTVGLISCEQKDLCEPAWYEGGVNVDFKNIAPTRGVEVNVPSGKGAVVSTVAGDTLAVIDQTREVDIPVSLLKNSQTRAIHGDIWEIDTNIVKITYIPIEEIENYGPKLTYYEVVAFEDLDDNDYDYNDIIIHTILNFSPSGKQSIKIQPIAYGAKNTIDLTVKVYLVDFKSKNDYKTTKLVSSQTINDVRTNLFGGKQGYINTDAEEIGKTKSLICYPITKELNPEFKMTGNDYLDVVYEIYVHETGKTYTSIPMTQRLASGTKDITGKDYNCSFDKNNIPFGLVFSNIYGGRYFKHKGDNGNCGADWFIYPAEKVDIETVYPNFREWLEGEYPTFNWSNPIGKYINSIGDSGERAIYEYNDLTSPIIVTRKNPFKFDITQFVN